MLFLHLTSILFYLATMDFCLISAEEFTKYPDRRVMKKEAFIEDFVRHVLLPHLQDHELVLIGSDSRDTFMEILLRKLFTVDIAAKMIEGVSFPSQEPATTWRDEVSNYRLAFVIYLPSLNNEVIERFLKDLKLKMISSTSVIFLGERGGQTILLNTTFQDIVGPLYFTVSKIPVRTSFLKKDILTYVSSKETFKGAKIARDVEVYRRCLYCRDGEPQVDFLLKWNPETTFIEAVNLFPDLPRHFQGHKLIIVALPYIPYTNYCQSGSNITLLDSLDTRVINVISKKLNITYEVKKPDDGQWGSRSETGEWNGIIGEMAKGHGDMSLLIGSSPERGKVVDFSPIYSEENFIVLSMKPGFLPQHLSLSRPFADMVWFVLMASVILVSILNWILETLRYLVLGGTKLSAPASFYSIWGTLLQNASSKMATSLTGKVVMIFWLYCSLVIASAYHSSLAAHLTVRRRTAPINNLEELVSRKHWTWSVEPAFSRRTTERLRQNANPVSSEIIRKMKVLDLPEGMQRVLQDRHALFTWRNYAETVIYENFTDIHERHPFYLSNINLGTTTGYGCSFRKGAPFVKNYNDAILRLNEAGLTTLWFKEVIRMRMSEVKKKHNMTEQLRKLIAEKDSKGHQVTLTLGHLQGAFILLLIGFAISLIALLGEKLLPKT